MIRIRTRPGLPLALIFLSAPLAVLSAAASAATPDAAPSGADAPAKTAKATPKPDGAASYSLGLSFATQWREGGLEGLLDEEGLIRGVRAGLAGKPLTADDRQRAGTLLHDAYEAWAARNKASAAEFLARNAKEPGVKTTTSGVQYLVMKKGEPSEPGIGPNDRITVQYSGQLQNGTVFDSTVSRGKPAVIRPSTVIAGWREALSMMGRGAQWRVFIPPDLAYGMTPPPAIPPNALLIFEIEVLAIEPAGAPPVAAH